LLAPLYIFRLYGVKISRKGDITQQHINTHDAGSNSHFFVIFAVFDVFSLTSVIAVF